MYLKHKGSLIVLLNLLALHFPGAGTAVVGPMFWLFIVVSIKFGTGGFCGAGGVTHPRSALSGYVCGCNPRGELALTCKLKITRLDVERKC